LDHLEEAADEGADDLRRHPLAIRYLVELADPELLEDVDCAVDRGFAPRAGRVDLDEAHLGGGGLVGDQAEEGFDRLAHPSLTRRGVLGPLDHLQGRLDQGGDGGQQQLFFQKRLFTYQGKKHGYLLAKCPDGHFDAQAEAVFTDGTKAKGKIVRACTPKG
jgi:hypothetical protein